MICNFPIANLKRGCYGLFLHDDVIKTDIFYFKTMFWSWTQLTLSGFPQYELGGKDYFAIHERALSSPKGLRAESARAVTGRQCPHSGEGEDFLTRRPGFFFFTKTAITRKQKVEKSLPTW